MADDPNSPLDDPAAGPVARTVRRRPKPGERRREILEALAAMLEQPGAERVTTAALAARLQVSEAALYRHFASKAQMFEGLIEFIENSLFGLVNKIETEQEPGDKQVAAIIAMLLGFAERNPGMTRVLTGDALVNEDPRLQARINQLMDRLEASVKQALRLGVAQAASGANPGAAVDHGAQANLIVCYVLGRWHQYAKSGFKRMPAEGLDKQLPFLT